MPTRSERLIACAKLVRTIAGSGRRISPEQERILRDARCVLLGIIRLLSNPNGTIPEGVLNAMCDLHPRTTQSRAMIIRDIADVCVTLERFEDNRTRSSGEKNSEAALACQFLSDELQKSGK